MNSNSSSKYSSVSQSSSIAPQDFTVSHQSNEANFGGHDSEDNSMDNVGTDVDSPQPLVPQVNNVNKVNKIDKHNKLDASAKKYWLQCRVCRCNRSTFFCSDCIRNGDFSYSKQRVAERFAEKKLKYFKIMDEQNAICDQIDKQLSNGFVKDDLVFKINMPSISK